MHNITQIVQFTFCQRQFFTFCVLCFICLFGTASVWVVTRVQPFVLCSVSCGVMYLPCPEHINSVPVNGSCVPIVSIEQVMDAVCFDDMYI